MPRITTQEKAILAIERMEEVIRNEMLVRGTYLTPTVVDQKLAEAGAVCGGRKACAIGSLYLGYGVKLDLVYEDDHDEGSTYELPGVGQGEREDFMRRRPALKLAYDELNAAADRYIAKADHATKFRITSAAFTSSLEGLFEAGLAGLDYTGTRKELLKVTRSAKRAIARLQDKQAAA